MRILSWNCNGAFRRKYQLLEKFDADILIIQECENPVYCKSQDYLLWACNFQWHGDSNHKGIGVFAKKNIVLTRNDWPDENLKYFLSVNVNGRFDLVNAWCHGANSPTFGYIGQFWKYLQINKQRMNNTLVAGDFNSNKIWDVWDRWWNHSDVISELEEIGIPEACIMRNTMKSRGKSPFQRCFYNETFQSHIILIMLSRQRHLHHFQHL